MCIFSTSQSCTFDENHLNIYYLVVSTTKTFRKLSWSDLAESLLRICYISPKIIWYDLWSQNIMIKKEKSSAFSRGYRLIWALFSFLIIRVSFWTIFSAEIVIWFWFSVILLSSCSNLDTAVRYCACRISSFIEIDIAFNRLPVLFVLCLSLYR